MKIRRVTSALVLVVLFSSSVSVFAAPAPDGVAPTHAASLDLRRSARAVRTDRLVTGSPWKAVTFQATRAHHRRGLWIAIGAASGAAGGAFLGAALQSLSESGESLTPSAVVGGALGGLAGALTAALLTRK